LVDSLNRLSRDEAMPQLILLLIIGALLVALLILVARLGSGPEGGAEALVRARQALTQLQTNLLTAELVDRFSSADDYEFVASSAPPSVNSSFRRERKKVMLAWIRQIQQQTASLLRFHLGAARFYTRLSFHSEVSLAMDFGSLLITCRTLQILVRFGGPRVAPSIVRVAAAAAARICEVSESALAFLTAPEPPVERSIAS